MKSERIFIRISPELKDKVKVLAYDTEGSMSELIVKMIEEAVVNAGTKRDPVQEKLEELETRIKRIEDNSSVSTW